MGGRGGPKEGKSNLIGDYYAVTYKEVINGTTYIRTRWVKRERKKTKQK